MEIHLGTIKDLNHHKETMEISSNTIQQSEEPTDLHQNKPKETHPSFHTAIISSREITGK
jgi:hypothetical protein